MTKKILKNIIILLCIILLLSTLINMTLPFYWGDTTQTLKFDFYKKNSEKFNAVYLGGSLEYRHVDPYVIDSVLQKKGYDFRSFNIAADGHTIIEEMTDLDGLLAVHNPDLKYIFFSISSEPYFFPANLHTSKWVSWHSAKSTIHALKIIPTLPDDLRTRVKFCYFYVISWLENLFKLGQMPEVIRYYSQRDTYNKNYLGTKENGFYPYDDEESHSFMEYKWEDTLIRKSKEEYINNSSKRDSLTNDIISSFENYKDADKANAAMVALCMEAYKKCAKKGIQLFFILPPRARTNYTLLLPVFNTMPEGSKIEVADPRKYPKYYEVDYGYNFHHLNDKGARLQSIDMAKQLVELMKVQRDTL